MILKTIAKRSYNYDDQWITMYTIREYSLMLCARHNLSELRQGH